MVYGRKFCGSTWFKESYRINYEYGIGIDAVILWETETEQRE